MLDGEKGAADLAAYFLRRCYRLTTPGGCFGFVLTNTISQGDTRLIGLEALIQLQSQIIYADADRKWPGNAATTISPLVVSKRPLPGRKRLDGVDVEFISSFLSAGSDFGTPKSLAQRPAIASTGTSLNGEGFILNDDEAVDMLASRESNREVIFPYLVAEDVNSRPDQSPSRHVINFGELDESKARLYAEPFDRVLRLVKPMRDKHIHQIHEACFWKHWDKRPALYASLARQKTTLVGGRVTKYVTFSLVPTSPVFSDRLVVVASDRRDLLAILQSSLHSVWVERLQTSMGETLGYSVSKCFTTWPWPLGTMVAVDPRLSLLGHLYGEFRSATMLRNSEGLTATYNRFHDPKEDGADIQKLRELHVEMDQAVSSAYGWSDLNLDHGFHETKQGFRYTISEAARREVLARLLKLNHERYAEEVKKGLHDPKKASAKKPKKAATPKPAEGSLFDTAEDE